MPIKSLLKSILLSSIAAVIFYLGVKLSQQHFQAGPKETEIVFNLEEQYKDTLGVANSLNGDGGELFLINFWATWCAPCVAEIPLLEKSHHEYYDQGYRVIGLSSDHSVEDVERFIQEFGVNYPIYMAKEDSIQQLSSINSHGGIPFSIFVDAKGNILDHKLGIFDHEALNHKIVSLLSK